MQGDEFMKKILKLMFFSSLLLSTTGCFRRNSLPNNDYQKVKFAFDGVEKSFLEGKTSNKSANKKTQNRYLANKETGLSTLYSLFTDDDIKEDGIEKLEYNQPPMIQFQYLKKVFEKVGENYSLGSKYYDTIQGEVYLDIQPGKKSQGEENKFNYNFLLSLEINLDQSDLITADVSFDIELARGEETYSIQWFVSILLDYDMNKADPNYTMTMRSENDERALPYRNCFIYEYDSVQVKDNEIQEWQKFCFESDRRLVKDSSHSTFQNYLDEQIACGRVTFAWFKDKVFKKNNQLTPEKQKTFVQILFEDLGLNAGEMKSDEFISKTGIQNNVIKTCYQEFSAIAKEDIIYSMLTTSDHKDNQDSGSVASIRAMNADLSGGAENYYIPDVTFGQFFNGYLNMGGQKERISLVYVDKHGAIKNEIQDYASLAFFFRLRDNDLAVSVSLDVTISDAYLKLYEVRQDISFITNECQLLFADENSIFGTFDFYYSGEIPAKDALDETSFPKELMSMGVPVYEGEKVEFEYDGSGITKILAIYGSNYKEAELYLEKLINNQFVIAEDIITYANQAAYSKNVSKELRTIVIFQDKTDGDTFYLHVYQELITN